MDHRSLIRCAVPDCEWGFKTQDTGEMDECYESFRLHCIAIHGLHPDNTESLISLRFGQFDSSAEDVAEDQL